MAEPTSAAPSRTDPVLLAPVPNQDRVTAPVPTPLTSFVGREREIEQIVALLRLANVRLITLTGLGGVGKARMALRVAAELELGFAAVVAFVSLAAIIYADLVDPTIVHAFGGPAITSEWPRSGEIMTPMHGKGETIGVRAYPPS